MRISKPLELSPDDVAFLNKIALSRRRPSYEVERSKIILAYFEDANLLAVSEALGVYVSKVFHCIKRVVQLGIEKGLKDRPRPGRAQKILEADRAWVVSLACQKPKDLSGDQKLPHELWTMSLLASFIKEHCLHENQPNLARINKSMVWKILNKNSIKPHKVKYYLERRDSQHEAKKNCVRALQARGATQKAE